VPFIDVCIINGTLFFTTPVLLFERRIGEDEIDRAYVQWKNGQVYRVPGHLAEPRWPGQSIWYGSTLVQPD